METREFREFLVADLALMAGAACAGDVAAALQRMWKRRDQGTSRASLRAARESAGRFARRPESIGAC
jgi:hypothetical protein